MLVEVVMEARWTPWFPLDKSQHGHTHTEEASAVGSWPHMKVWMDPLGVRSSWQKVVHKMKQKNKPLIHLC